MPGAECRMSDGLTRHTIETENLQRILLALSPRASVQDTAPSETLDIRDV